MWERRVVVCLCVLMAHVVAIYLLSLPRKVRLAVVQWDGSEPITLDLPPLPLPLPRVPGSPQAPHSHAAREVMAPTAAAPVPDGVDSGELSAAPPPRPDWGEQARTAAARILAADAERERTARMFSGAKPGSFSIAPRPPVPPSRMRWKNRLTPFDFDEEGRPIYWLSENCYLRPAFMGKGSHCTADPNSESCKLEAANNRSTKMMCFIGKNPVHIDMFDEMAREMDQRRLPDADVP